MHDLHGILESVSSSRLLLSLLLSFLSPHLGARDQSVSYVLKRIQICDKWKTQWEIWSRSAKTVGRGLRRRGGGINMLYLWERRSWIISLTLWWMWSEPSSLLLFRICIHSRRTVDLWRVWGYQKLMVSLCVRNNRFRRRSSMISD